MRPLWANELVAFAALEPSDAALVAAWWNDRSAMEYNIPMVMAPMSQAAAAERVAARANAGGQWTWIIVEQASQARIGQVSLQILDRAARVGRVALLISAQWRGRGLGAAALDLLLHFGFLELDLLRIELNVLEPNAPALRTYTRLGFQDEGRLRSAVFRDGQRLDWLQMGLLREEWKPLRP